MSLSEIVAKLPCGVSVEKDVSLAPLTSWKVGGKADCFVQPRTARELGEAVAWAQLRGLALTLLGGGTNVLISDNGVSGLTISLQRMSGTEVRELEIDGEKKLIIECLAGTAKSELLKIFLKHKLAPALFLAGLPGDVGGGIAMNAGVGEALHPREFVEITDWIEVLRWSEAPRASRLLPENDEILKSAADFETMRFRADQLEWGYRSCRAWGPGIITRVGVSWPLAPMDEVLDRVKSANRIRLAKQPLDMPSCGSVFVNPEGHKSGQLIEQCGLKGFSIGSAQVSPKHANFIVNTGGATAAEIDQVIRHVQAIVLARTGVSLKAEIVYLGRW